MTFRDKVGQAVLPPFLSVYSDPTARKYGSTELAGFYQFDDEGVRARKVTVVERHPQKLSDDLASPIDGFPESNGHGRKGPFYAPVAGRQSNLLVVASLTVTRRS
jgi:TldD protein